MDLVILREPEIVPALRALREVVASNGRVTPAERRFLEVVAELHATTTNVDALTSIVPAEVAARHHRATHAQARRAARDDRLDGRRGSHRGGSGQREGARPARWTSTRRA